MGNIHITKHVFQRRLSLFRYLSMTILSVLLFMIFVLNFASVGFVEAFPFGKSSGVVELNPRSLNQFVSTHKPVYILFYAPWCGHCRNIHPEWEKFAKAVEGTIRVGAINADEHKEISSRFGISGFPTIKFWKAGKKTIDDQEDYKGPRDARSIQASAMGLVSSSKVKNILSADGLRGAIRDAEGKNVAVLFSSKAAVPATFAVLSHSPLLKQMSFCFVGSQAKSTTVAQEFGVTKLPGIAVFSETDGDLKTTLYQEKNFAYESIEKFLSSFVDGDLSGSEESADADEKAAKSGGKKSAPSRVKTLPPVAPVRVSRDLLETFCSPAALKFGDSPRLCVFSLTSEFSLNEVYSSFRHEPIIFFEAHADRDILLDFVQNELGMSELKDSITDTKTNRMLLLRAQNSNTIRYLVVDGIDIAIAVDLILKRVMTGELSLLKKTVN